MVNENKKWSREPNDKYRSNISIKEYNEEEYGWIHAGNRNLHGKKLFDKDKWNIICRKNMRKFRAINYFKITKEEYEKLTEKCVICGWNKVVDLHHIDGDKTNNNISNFVGLCPNHHKLAHMKKIDFVNNKEL